jgi:uncharacterized protein
MRGRRWLFRVIALVAALLGLSFVAAAILTEGALHPLLRRHASDTAALAYSIAHASGGKVQQIRIHARDGTLLDAWWLSPQKPSGEAVIACHGVADSAFGAMGYALLFLKNGYSVLVPESRGHGESRGYVTYGVLEAEDTVRWLDWIKSQGVKAVFGFGESLGGAILLQSLAHGADFRALVVECSYSSFKTVADERIGRFTSPIVAKFLVDEGLLYTRLRYRVDLSQARPDLAIRHAHAPILLIHGTGDRETIPEHSERLAQANSSFTELWLVPGAKHTGAYATAPREFEEKVLQWFRNPSANPMELQ